LSGPAFDRVLIPGEDAPASLVSAATRWARERSGRPPESVHEPGLFAYDASALDMAAHRGRALTDATALYLEYPTSHLSLQGAAWPAGLLLRPLAFALSGMGVVLLMHRRGRQRRCARGPVIRVGAAA
jgi:hypothetical protein